MLLRGGPSGFVHAPVSKFLVLATGGASLLASVFKSHTKLHLTLKGISSGQLWRLVTSQFVFTSPSEILFGLIALYSFRVFERQRGSAKFAMWACFTSVASSLIQLGTLTMFPRTYLIAPGPYPFIFSAFTLYYYDIPTTYYFKILGLSFPDKAFTYVLGAELMFSAFPYGLYAALSGLVAGALYSSDILGVSSLNFPTPIRRFFGRFILPLLDTAPARRSARRQQQQQRMMPQGAGMGGQGPLIPPQFQNAPRPAPVPSEPPREEDVQQLVDIGFPRDAVIRALQATGGNVAAASNMLLDAN